VYPAQYRSWFATLDARAAASAASAGPRAPHTPAAPGAPLRIASPADGAVYSVDPTLRREFQALPLRAVTSRPTTVRWRIDGAPVGTASSEKALAWPLAVGTHRIEVEDTDGRRATTSVVVK
jgi:membrane carboxypeptidase/penicillin-binding protein PbpC